MQASRLCALLRGQCCSGDIQQQNDRGLALFYCMKVTRGAGSFPLLWVLTAPRQAPWCLVLIRGAVPPGGAPWPGHGECWQCVTGLTSKRWSPPIISGQSALCPFLPVYLLCSVPVCPLSSDEDLLVSPKVLTPVAEECWF